MEKITNIEINNFKSIRHAEIKDCSKINVFIGYPNVGKSNILEALGLYSILLFSQKEDFKIDDICRVKHIAELFFNQNYSDGASILLNGNRKLDLRIKNSLNQLDLDFQSFNIEKKLFEGIFGEAIMPKVFANQLYIDNHIGLDFSFEKFAISPIKYYHYSNNSLQYKNNGLSLNIPHGNNLLDVLQREPILRKEVVGMFQEYGLKLLIDRIDNTLKFQKELSDGTAVNIPYHQVADTLRRLIFYKAAIATNSNSVLLFEEPEAHMFPPYVKKFTSDVIFDETNQFFIATHSPFVLNEFIEEAQDDLSVYVVDYDNGETVIKRLTDEQVTEVAQYGIDLFFNLESYLDKYGQPHSA